MPRNTRLKYYYVGAILTHLRNLAFEGVKYPQFLDSVKLLAGFLEDLRE